MALSKQLVKTRQMTECPIFGRCSDLSEVVLPTYEDVMECYNLTRYNLKGVSGIDPSVKDICESLVPKILNLWFKASIPVVSNRRVVEMIKSYHYKYRNLLKSKNRKGTEKYDSNLDNFRKDGKNLFDIAACKCHCFKNCNCKKESKVPMLEQEFLKDQRSSRKMVIGTIDTPTTKALIKKQARKANEELRVARLYQDQSQYDNVIDHSDESNQSIPGPSNAQQAGVNHNQPGPSSSQEEIYQPTPSSSKKPGNVWQMRIKLPSVASICDRTGISDRTAAAIASATLQDFGIITDEDKTKVIDRMKIRRERSKNKSKMLNYSQGEGVIENRGLFFDGRKDRTILQEKKGAKYYKKVVLEEHITLIEEPNSNFLGHVSPKSGTGKDIAVSILEFIAEKEDNGQLLNFTAIGCDGTAVNTGINNGVIPLLEKKVERSLQWLVCLFHGNELPLRHLFRHLDGKTKGPNEFKGEIGQQLENCTDLPVDNFLPIENNLPVFKNIKDLSTDQKYLMKMCKAISSGCCAPDLALRNPGKLAHSRWLTLANRILRLYVSTDSPSDKLQTLSEYIVKVYAPVWFNVKLKPSCTYGSKHLYKLISFSRYLSNEYKNVIDPVIQRNGYFAAAENVLLAMLCDERKSIRELGLRRVLKARTESTEGVRRFKIPKINFDAKDYIEMISWRDGVTEPPMVKHVSSDSLKEFINKTSQAEQNREQDYFIDFPRLPCHTQAVERAVQLVTESAQNVCGATAREGYIRAKLESREKMPKFDTKKQFKQ